MRVLSVGEAATGLALMFVPQLVVRLLFGADTLAGPGLAAARLAGVALIALGIACWPERGATSRAQAAMLVYNALAAIYLGALAIDGGWRGPLLWPAVAVHVVMTLLLAKAAVTTR